MTELSSAVFLVGSQRSGTTALGLALNAAYACEDRTFTVNGKLPYVLHRWLRQSDINGLHLRSDEITYSLVRRRPYGAGATRWVEKACDTIHDCARLLAQDDPGLPRSVAALTARIVADVYGTAGNWGDKYNEYMLDLDSLRPLAPGIKILLLVRDPAEVAASMVRWTPQRAWCPTTIEHAQAKWTQWHEQFLTHPVTARVPLLVVDYADLRGERVARQIGEFCELDAAIDRDGLHPRTAPQLPPRLPKADRLWSCLRQMAPGAVSLFEEAN